MTDLYSAASRSIPLRRRPDLVLSPQEFGTHSGVVVKDPVSLRYYQLRVEEAFLLEQLDGERSLEELRAAFQQRFAPARVSFRQLQSYLSLLHREGLVLADTEGEGPRLWERAERQRRSSLLGRFANVLAIRFRGVDPDRFLDRLYPRVRWLFSPAVLLLAALLVLAAALCVTAFFGTVQSRLPDLNAFLGTGHLVWFAVALAGCKILHELGHALTCKHFGGRCHELGVMLLVFTPCLYVNVSDAWLLPNRWQRIAISAAGIGVELVLAAIATFAWWWTDSGFLHTLALHVMLVASVGTILFNGNPLLRYDGYYVLSDLVQVPNLQQRSNAVLRRWLVGLLFGVPLAGDRLFPHRHPVLLGLYAVLAITYRYILVVLILSGVYVLLRSHGLQVLAHLLTILVVGLMLIPPALRACRWCYEMKLTGRIRTRRLLAAATVVLVALTGALFIPLPNRVVVPAALETADAARVYVSVAGELEMAVPAGAIVRRGQVIGRLANREIAMEVIRLIGQRDMLQSQLETLAARNAVESQRGDRDAGARIPVIGEALADVKQRLERKLAQQNQLTLTASQSGVVLPPPRRQMAGNATELPAWKGTPLDEENLGTHLETGTLFCLVGDPQRMEAALVVAQEDIRLVAPGQTVHLRFGQLPGRLITAEVSAIARLDTETLPDGLAASGAVPVRRDGENRLSLAGVYYLVRVALPESSQMRLPGGVGRAAIHVPSRSLGRRIYEWACGTFRFLP